MLSFAMVLSAMWFLNFAEGLVTGLTQLVKDSIMKGGIFAKIGAMLVKQL